MADGEEGEKPLKLVLHYQITLLGSDAFEACEAFGKAVADARHTYVDQIRQLATKYMLPPEEVNALATVFLNPLAIELFGFGTPITTEVRQLRASNEDLMKRLPELDLIGLLEKELDKRRQAKTESP